MICPYDGSPMHPCKDFDIDGNMFQGMYVCKYGTHYEEVNTMAYNEITVGGDIIDWTETKAVEGTLQGVRDSKFGKAYDIETAKGLRTVFSNAVLEQLMSAVAVGDKIKIQFVGEATSQAGRKYRKFKLFRDD